MTLVDPIGDMFTRIRNGQMRNLNSVNIPASKFRSKILEILKTEILEILETWEILEILEFWNWNFWN